MNTILSTEALERGSRMIENNDPFGRIPKGHLTISSQVPPVKPQMSDTSFKPYIEGSPMFPDASFEASVAGRSHPPQPMLQSPNLTTSTLRPNNPPTYSRSSQHHNGSPHTSQERAFVQPSPIQIYNANQSFLAPQTSRESNHHYREFRESPVLYPITPHSSRGDSRKMDTEEREPPPPFEPRPWSDNHYQTHANYFVPNFEQKVPESYQNGHNLSGQNGYHPLGNTNSETHPRSNRETSLSNAELLYYERNHYINNSNNPYHIMNSQPLNHELYLHHPPIQYQGGYERKHAKHESMGSSGRFSSRNMHVPSGHQGAQLNHTVHHQNGPFLSHGNDVRLNTRLKYDPDRDAQRQNHELPYEKYYKTHVHSTGYHDLSNGGRQSSDNPHSCLSPLSLPTFEEYPPAHFSSSASDQATQHATTAHVPQFVPGTSSSFEKYAPESSKTGGYYYSKKTNPNDTGRSPYYDSDKGKFHFGGIRHLQRDYNSNYPVEHRHNQVQHDGRKFTGQVPNIIGSSPVDPQHDFFLDRRDDYSGSTIQSFSSMAPGQTVPLPCAHSFSKHHNEYFKQERPQLHVEIPMSPIVKQTNHPGFHVNQQNYNNRPPNTSRSNHTHRSSSSNVQPPNSSRSLPINPKGHLRLSLAEEERKNSEARHQIMKEIHQATNMRNSALDENDRNFWERQIATLNESFKNL